MSETEVQTHPVCVHSSLRGTRWGKGKERERESSQWGIKQISLLHQMVTAIYDLLSKSAENAEIQWSRLIKYHVQSRDGPTVCTLGSVKMNLALFLSSYQDSSSSHAEAGDFSTGKIVHQPNAWVSCVNPSFEGPFQLNSRVGPMQPVTHWSIRIKPSGESGVRVYGWQQWNLTRVKVERKERIPLQEVIGELSREIKWESKTGRTLGQILPMEVLFLAHMIIGPSQHNSLRGLRPGNYGMDRVD